MRLGLSLALILLFALAGVQGAAAQDSLAQAASTTGTLREPPTPAGIAPPRNVFAQQLTQQEWRYLNGQLRNGYTVQHMPVIDAMQVEFVPDSEQLMPAFLPHPLAGQPGLLQVPRGFLRNICAMIEFNLYASAIGQAERQALAAELLACSHSRATSPQCVISIMASNQVPFADPELADENIRAIGQALSVLIRTSTIQTARYILAHEVGHAVTRSTNTREQLALIDEEFEADVLAQLAVMDAKMLPFGPLSVLAAQAWIEGAAPPLAGLHDPAICRLRAAENVLAPILSRTSAIAEFQDSTSVAVDFTTSDSLSAVFANFDAFAPTGATTSCRETLPGRIDALMRDLGRVEQFVRSAGPIEGGNPRLDEQLDSLALETDAGHRVAASVLIVQEMRSRSMAAAMLQLTAATAGTETGASAQTLMGNTLGRANALLSEIDLQNMRPTEVAVISQVDALSQFAVQPPGTGILLVSNELITAFEASFVYESEFQYIDNAFALISFFPEYLDMAREQVMTRFLTNAPFVGARAIMNNCEHIAYVERLRPVFNPQSSAEQNGVSINCEIARRELIDNWESRMGWVWDGQPLDSAGSSAAASQ